MALSPETKDALDKALGAVIEECGDDPQYASLVTALGDAQDALPAGGDAPADEPDGDEPDMPVDEPDEKGDPFDVAMRKHTAARKPKADEDA